jgi:phenylacetate-CoA ligase
LRRLIDHAWRNVPYYREIFEKTGLTPDKIRDAGDLERLPFLTRDIIRDRFDDLTARNIPPGKRLIERTSGSSGSPLAFFVERPATHGRERAFLERLWNRVGCSSHSRCVHLTWQLPGPGDRPYFYNPVSKALSLSPFHLDDAHIKDIHRSISRFRPAILKSIPSALLLLIRMLRRHRLPAFPTVKAVMLASEMVFPWQRQEFETYFGCRVTSFYGMVEKVVMAGECEFSSRYHIFPEYGVTELIGKDGKRVKGPGEPGEIVGTGFINFAMPFIRYRTGDMARLSDRPCQCGRRYPILEAIEGRKQEFIVLRDGRLAPVLSLPFSSFLKEARNFKFYQEKPGELILILERGRGFTDASSQSILHSLHQALGDIRVELRFVSEIPRTGNGKDLYMIQKLPIDF